MTRRHPAHGLVAGAALAVALLLTKPGAALAATATCTDPVAARTWRATWTVAGSNGSISKLEYKANGTSIWVDASNQTAELRWDNVASDYVGVCFPKTTMTGCTSAPLPDCSQPGVTCDPGQSCNGIFNVCSSGTCATSANCLPSEDCLSFSSPFQPDSDPATLGLQPLRSPVRKCAAGTPNPGAGCTADANCGGTAGSCIAALPTVPMARSPRLVAPNGSCQVYLKAFNNGGANPRVIVVGDSLTQSLNDMTYNVSYPQGYVQGNLNANARKVEVEGQGGRRWVASTTGTALENADSNLLDELRGLRTAASIDAIVVALGANDAGWIASGATDPIRQQRLTETLAGIDAIVSEMAGWGKCTVAVTGPDNLGCYYGVSDPWLYAWAAQQVNNHLRAKVAANPSWLRLRDFAALSVNHHTWDPDNWFANDNLHLNDAGKLVYTNEIVQGALALCP